MTTDPLVAYSDADATVGKVMRLLELAHWLALDNMTRLNADARFFQMPEREANQLFCLLSVAEDLAEDASAKVEAFWPYVRKEKEKRL